MSNKIIRLIDRTRTVQDWKCPRSRYWGYEFMGKGIVKSNTSLELFMGIVLHDAFAAIGALTKAGLEIDIDKIAEAGNVQMFNSLYSAVKAEGDLEAREFAYEQSALVEGIIRGFYKHVWPKLMAQYTIIAVESELTYPLAEGFEFMTKPDLLVEDKVTNELVYIEYKSTSSKKDKWVNSWDTAVQLHSSILACEHTLGKRPDSVQIVGMYKGYESYGKQSSPFCYAYKRAGNPPFSKDQIEYAYKAGFRRFATWELPGGVKAWVEGMPDNVLADQFPMTPPIMVDEELVTRFFKQREYREIQIANAVTLLSEFPEDEVTTLDVNFPQHFDQCEPSFGYNCSYRKLCHGGVANPFTEGYEFRTPHHAPELEQWERIASAMQPPVSEPNLQEE